MFVINKADRPGRHRGGPGPSPDAVARGPEDWTPADPRDGGARPARASRSCGRRWPPTVPTFEPSGLLEERRADRVEQELRKVLVAVMERGSTGWPGSAEYAEALDDVRGGRADPYEVADRLLESS